MPKCCLYLFKDKEVWSHHTELYIFIRVTLKHLKWRFITTISVTDSLANGSSLSPSWKACEKPNNFVWLTNVYFETGSFKLLYLLHVKSAFGFALAEHSSVSGSFPLEISTSMGVTARDGHREWTLSTGLPAVLTAVKQSGCCSGACGSLERKHLC